VNFFSLYDFAAPPGSPEWLSHVGLIDSAGAAKPAWFAFRDKPIP
jgi:hypothetical protein